MSSNVPTWASDGRPVFQPPTDAVFRRIHEPSSRVQRRRPALPGDALPEGLRAGVIANARSHRNRNGVRHEIWPELLYASPRTQDALLGTLRDYAAQGVDLLVVDGGDGTVRDVITAAGKVFNRLPQFAVLPSGKTNALAMDLGIPAGWNAQAAIKAARAGRLQTRSPLEITRHGSIAPDLRGFLFGAGRFVQATELAQRTHKVGAFDGVAVGLSLGWSVLQTLFGRANNEWKRGHSMQIRTDDGQIIDRSLYLLLASTLERMPLGLKPFGRTRGGLKVLTIDAPPRRVVASLVPLLSGAERRWLSDAGYHRADPARLWIALKSGFILDGEHYEGGEFALSTGEPLQFVVP